MAGALDKRLLGEFVSPGLVTKMVMRQEPCQWRYTTLIVSIVRIGYATSKLKRIDLFDESAVSSIRAASFATHRRPDKNKSTISV